MDDSYEAEHSAPPIWVAGQAGDDMDSTAKVEFTIGELARDFGVAPTTLARLLVSRGIEVLSERDPEA